MEAIKMISKTKKERMEMWAKEITENKEGNLVLRDTSVMKEIFDLLKEGLAVADVAKKLKKPEDKLYGKIRKIHQRMLLSKTKTTTQKVIIGNSDEVEPSVTIHKQVDMASYIPKTDGYISRSIYGSSDVKIMELAYANKDFIIVIGETGSGKTHLVRHVAYKKKVPYFRVNMTGATTPDDLIGQWIPNPNTGDAKYIWQDGSLTTFMRNGGVFVIDEINMTPADITSMLHSITDDERRLVLTQKDGEVVTAHPDFWLVVTMNPDYEGTRPLNLALKDRFRPINLEYNVTVERKLGVSEKMIEVATSLRKSDEIHTPVSTRDLLKYRDDVKNYGETIARAFFVNNFEAQEIPVVNEVVELQLDGKKIEDDNEETKENEFDTTD